MTALVTQDDKGLSLSEDQKQLIKDTYFKGSTDNEFHLFLHVCQKHNLDPILKQIHPVKRWDKKLGRETTTYQTGIDGFRTIAERTGCYAPGKEPTYIEEGGKVISATAYVKKKTNDGTWHEVAATAYYSEYVQTDREGKPTPFWSKMPHNQLAKCAEALALRKAFPNTFSGLYTHEEMAQADSYKEADVEILTPTPKTQESDPSINATQKMILEKALQLLSEKRKKDFYKYIHERYQATSLETLKSKHFNAVKNALIKAIDMCNAEVANATAE